MYKKNDLKKFDYFNNLLKKNKLEYLLDPLTGVVSRRYMIDFVKYLIDNNKPFNLCMLDLDNFKDINDKYGHAIGDIVLENIGKDLISYTKNGVVGRYGGDEFILILFDTSKYEDVHNFFAGMFHNNTVLRKNIQIGDINIYYTGTVGSAIFPDNAKNYDELFEMSDKTLYRGKIKGRNCYIIYVHEKHKDLVIQKLANDDLTTIFNNIYQTFNTDDDLDNKLMHTYKYLNEAINMQHMYYIDEKHNLYDVENMDIVANNIILDNIKFNNNMYITNYQNNIKDLNINLYQAINNKKISSLLIYRIKLYNNNYGYIMYALERACKIWQNDEIGVLMYLANNILISKINK